MIIILEWITTTLAITGVIANNYKRRWCFLVFMVSNTACLFLHLRVGYYAMCFRDLVFFALAIHGWIAWGKRK